MNKRENKFWQDWNNIEQILRQSMSENHGLIPGSQWFKKNGYSSLFVSIHKYGHGTIEEIRIKFGIANLKYCPNCDQVLNKSKFRVRRKQKGENKIEIFRDSICKKCSAEASAGYRRTPKGMAAEVYRRTKERSRETGKPFNLTKEWIFKRLNDLNWCCQITGVPFYRNGAPGLKSIYSLSVDRIDSNYGYTIDNVQFVINWVNIAKQRLSNDEFYNLCLCVVNGSLEK